MGIHYAPSEEVVWYGVMREKFVHSLMVSLEWRVIAFVITGIFLWITTGHLLTATGLALVLQIILFIAYVLWYFLRQELKLPLFPGFSKIIRGKNDTATPAH